MTLHTLNAAPGSTAFADCLRLAASGDCILLLGNGVYAALAGSEAWARLEPLQQLPVKIVVLQPDADAAGIADRLAALEVIDYAGFVALSEEYPRQLAWF